MLSEGDGLQVAGCGTTATSSPLPAALAQDDTFTRTSLVTASL